MINMLGKSEIIITQKLGESLAAEVFLATNENTKESVFIKKIRPEFANADIKEHILHQQSTLLQLGAEELIVPEITIDSDGTLLLIVPRQEGQIFTKWLADRKEINIKTLLEIGIALADSLISLHKVALIHKGVKPCNILIQENPVRIHLIDEIKVSDISSFSHFILDNQYKRETLPYISPEQTGKIRFDVNYCSDLYAMGAILYECATGRPPFLSDDSLSIIHSHLAEIPSPASGLNQDCPKIISDIIATLLEKAPERRYQSATGIKADLQTCLSSWEKTEKDALSSEVPSFVLKQKDFSNQISLPSIMVGRDRPKSRLLDEYQRVSTGKFGIAIISGLSGMGKTRLIQELERPIVAKRGYYTFGKFNQYNKHLPYATLIEAFSRLIRQFLTEDVKRVEYWRKQILDATGENAQLLVDLIPELVHLIGKQPDVPLIPPAEAQNRFNDITCRFLASLASAKHPLVLFIDDMQWCDSATFDLLNQIVLRRNNFSYLLIIGAYRNNEVSEDHRIIQIEKTITALFQPLLKLHIDSLEQHFVNEMIAFILNASISKTRDLTNIIYPVSAGNPLFVNESLRWLHNNNRLFLSENGTWTWDADVLINLQLPASAKALFYDKLKQLPKDVINILSIASLIGVRFEAKDLALVTQIPLQKLYSSLKNVLYQRILLQDKSTLAFFHDQIQAAASDFLNKEEHRKYHKQIARAFIDELQEKENQKDNEVSVSRLFSIVEHLNVGHTDDDFSDYSDDERFEEAQFNFRAGVAAMDSLALDACNHYFSRSAKLCFNRLWQTDYDFMFALYKKFARAVLINGDQSRSEEIVKIAMNYAQSDLDRAECLYEQAVAYGSLGQVENCINSGSRALELMSETIPISDDEIQLEIDSFLNQLHHDNSNIWKKIIGAHLINGRKATLMLHLYSEMLSSFYLSGQVDMFFLMSLRTINMAIKNGVNGFTCYALNNMAVYFQLQEDYPLANKYEDAFLMMVKRFPDTFGSVRALAAAVWGVLHSRNNVSGLQVFCQQAMDSGMKCGELAYAAYARCALIWFSFIQGNNLHQIKSQIEGLISFSQQFNLAHALGMGEALQMSLQSLWESGSTRFDESYVSARLSFWIKQGHIASLACYFTFNGIVACYNHSYSEAEHFLNEGEAYLAGISNTIVYRLWYVFRYLVALQTGDKNDIESYLEKVTNWASHGPILKPYLALMQAETMALHGDLSDIRNAYLNAIDLSHKEQYLFLEAFLNERLGVYLKNENHFSYRTYLNTAIKLYQNSGAQTKAIRLSSIVSINEPDVKIPLLDKTLIKKEQKTEHNHTQVFDKELDYNYLFSAVKAITEELDFNRLLKIIMESVMARLGAKTGYLLIVEKENLIPYVSGIKNENIFVAFNTDPDFSTSKLCMGIARYVFHTKKMLLLNDAGTDGDFISEEVVQRENLQSVLCFPLIMQKHILGVLYLENSLIKSIFSDSQVELTGLLIAQAAIALQNAILLQNIKLVNQNLEERVEIRTKELNKVNTELKDFAYVISHDLKAPLRGIIQLVSWILEDYNDKIDEDGQEMFGLLQNRTKQMHAMIEGILNYSRIGRSNEPDKDIDLNKLVENIVDLLAAPESIKFRVVNRLPVIRCEETLIFQVFQNLFDNAVKYMDKEKGEITIDCVKENGAWKFCIADNGPGIEKKYQQKIFQLFQTLKPKDETDNTGIGLALVQKIIYNWKGRIWLESENEIGTSFFFTIPTREKNGKNI